MEDVNLTRHGPVLALPGPALSNFLNGMGSNFRTQTADAGRIAVDVLLNE